MTDLANRGPLGLKEPNPEKPKYRKPMRAKAKKRSEKKARFLDPVYLTKVRLLPCATCGAPAPNDAHHCRDIPPYNEQGLYTRLPGAALTSGDRDAIPLCRGCHDLFHRHRGEFNRQYGSDYGFIPSTRAALSDEPGEIDF